MKNYREYMREAIKTPVDDASAIGFGKWAILNSEQRKLIGRLLNEMDSADACIKKMYLETQQLKDRLDKAIEYIETLKTEYNNRSLDEKNLWIYEAYIKGISNLIYIKEILKGDSDE